MTNEMVEYVARAIAKENGDDYDAIPATKAEWNYHRGVFGGRFRDMKEPKRGDYNDMAIAAINAMRAFTAVEPTV